MSEILELGYELAGPTGSDGAVERLHRAQIESVAGQTLATMAGVGGEAARTPTSIEARTPRPENGSGASGEHMSEPGLSRAATAPAILSERD